MCILLADKAFLEYTEDNKTINVLHVYVPEVFRGKNVAKLLSQVINRCFCNKELVYSFLCSSFPLFSLCGCST